MLAMFIVVVFVIIGFDIVIKTLVWGGIRFSSLVLIRLVHSLICAFVLFAEYEILYARRMSDEKAETERVLAERERQYRLSRENIEAINIKCHDIRHQIRHYADAGEAIDKDALVSIAREVNVYDSVVETGNEALDTILTEKSLACSNEDIVLSCIADGAALEFRDQVVRNDLELSKKSESDNAGLMVPFAIENAATGETHVLITDRNGDASTASSWNRHSRDTNANDALLGHEGPIGAADMDPKAGIWFSLGEDGSSAPVDDSLAALPYGAYTMTELRCEANEGLELITRSFWIDRDSTVAKAVWMGLDDREGPRISTTAKDGADGDKDVSADAEAKVVDAVAYEGLKAGEEYELSATLVDKATGEPVADASGMPVEAKAEFAPALSTGSRDVEISFDASLLGGRDLVVFESLRKDGAEVASHADLSDEGQTVHVAVEVGTQAADAADGDQVIEAGKAKVVDTVAYKGLVPGETYIAVGTLMDKGTGEPFLDKDGNEVTARTPFEPEAPSGTVEVTFEFDTEGLAEGDELVVFEKVLDSAGNVVATHEDIDSAEQSVVVDNPDTPEVPEEPYAKTGADAPDGTGYAVAAGIALAAAAGAGGALAYRKRKAVAASKGEAAEEPEE